MTIVLIVKKILFNSKCIFNPERKVQKYYCLGFSSSGVLENLFRTILSKNNN